MTMTYRYCLFYRLLEVVVVVSLSLGARLLLGGVAKKNLGISMYMCMCIYIYREREKHHYNNDNDKQYDMILYNTTYYNITYIHISIYIYI